MIRSGLASDSAAAAAAMMGASSVTGLRHLPAIRARVTWMPRPGGAKPMNCGSLNRLTEGMIRPMRAVGTAMRSAPACLTATASMLPPTVLTFRFGRPTAPAPAWPAQTRLGNVRSNSAQWASAYSSASVNATVNCGFSRRSVAVRSMTPRGGDGQAHDVGAIRERVRDRSTGDVTNVLPAHECSVFVDAAGALVVTSLVARGTITQAGAAGRCDSRLRGPRFGRTTPCERPEHDQPHPGDGLTKAPFAAAGRTRRPSRPGG